MKAFIWGLLILVCTLPSNLVSSADRSHTSSAFKHAHVSKIDPRVLDVTDPDPQFPLSYFRFVAGKKYIYHFESKAAHMGTRLPDPDKVTPQIALEDMGLFPFTVVYGTVTLETVCLSPRRRMLFEVRISNVTVECSDDAARVNNSCDYVKQTALSLTKYRFWFTHNSRGEIVGLDFMKDDPVDVRGIKQSLIYEFSMTTPNITKKERPEIFGRLYKINGKTVATRYRISPFTKHAHHTGTIDGIIVRKERFSSRPSDIPRIENLYPFVYRRNTWVYMVIGGDIAPSSGPSPVPTRICSLEETQVDPAHVAWENPGHKEPLFILSRIEWSLRSISAGRDRTADLLINDTCGLNELDVYYSKHYRPRPPISFIEQRGFLHHTGSGHGAQRVDSDVGLSTAQEDDPAALERGAPIINHQAEPATTPLQSALNAIADLNESPRQLLVLLHGALAATS